MNTLNLDDLECLALGAAILGSGGGGSPSYNHMMAQHMIDKHGQVQMLDISELKPDDLIVPIAFMGAPLVALEKIASGHEFPAVFEAIKNHVGKGPTVIMPAEIGGANAFTPLWVGAMLGLPVLNADTIGRAFPELQMSSCTIHHVSASPAFLADSLGNVVTIQAYDAQTVERIARHVTMSMGSRAAIAFYLMKGEEAGKKVIEGSISKGITIGRALLEARRNRHDPLLAVLEKGNGIKVCSGIISDVDHRIEGGFLMGKSIITTREGESVQLLYQNEYLIATQGREMLACTPDILMLLEQETATPITSATLDFGMRVDLIALPAPEIWKSPQALSLVGPRYFGYDVDYKPINCKENR